VDLARRLADLLPRLRPREVYVPLGVGGHVDHRICHEAALRVMQSGAGRNVFLYEERPESFVPGAVRVRLGQVGARLPPAASAAATEGGLARFLLGFHTAPHVRAQVGGMVERFRCTGEAARDWREARAWHPQRAFGPRLQPLLQPGTPAGVEALRERAAAAGRSGAALVARAEAYARRVGAGGHAERYWLLLPVREGEGQALAAAAAEPLAG
jgi:LmbE family N-acetylglucosaminyl deacetylase